MQEWIKDQFEWYRDNKNIITVSRTADMLSWDGFFDTRVKRSKST